MIEVWRDTGRLVHRRGSHQQGFEAATVAAAISARNLLNAYESELTILRDEAYVLAASIHYGEQKDNRHKGSFETCTTWGLCQQRRERFRPRNQTSAAAPKRRLREG